MGLGVGVDLGLEGLERTGLGLIIRIWNWDLVIW